jgi:hypothetical protein
MTATLTVLHPGIETTRDAKPALAARLTSFEGKRVALLDNGKVNAGAFIKAVAARLQKLGMTAGTRSWRKAHASEGGDKHWPELVAWKPDLVLTGLGD